MSDKQALNATFFAFRKREKAVLLPATIAFAVVAIVMFGAFSALNWQAFIDYMNWAASISSSSAGAAGGGQPSMDAMMPPQSVMSIAPTYFLLLLGYYILLASYEAACLRWMIHGETSGLFGLSLGADTWRVYFGYWVWFLLLIAFYIVCAIVAGGAFASIMMGMQGGAEPSANAVIVPLVIGLLVVVALIYFSVRFAPAAATSVARKKFAFFDAWTVSKGRFWALLGAFVLLFLMFFVFVIAVEVAFGVMVGMSAASSIGHTEPQSAEEAFRAFATPQYMAGVIAIIVALSFASMMFYIALFGVNARAAALALEEGKITVSGA
ncbi:MAG: hypothetical protein KF779_06115 [Hyphomonadaceae bacterium]|nr:hypothetical protein [Hyphomonadaceae bacterium]